MRKYFFAIMISLSLVTCVSKSEHERVVSEMKTLEEERDKLKEELRDIKFGAPNLLSEGKAYYVAKDFSQAREKFKMLVEKHSSLPQSIEGKKYLLLIDEEELWQNASTSDDISFSEKYIDNYPKGKYIAKAVRRQKDLKVLNMQKAFKSAVDENTSSAWKAFLESYPNHNEAASIRRKIIKLEVDEILGDSKTGEIPTFSQYGSSYSSTSNVKITNDTGCELTVRYSGPDVEIISIAVGSTRSVHLASGSYKIAASACGANYAGIENLRGEYSSTFYIRTIRY